MRGYYGSVGYIIEEMSILSLETLNCYQSQEGMGPHELLPSQLLTPSVTRKGRSLMNLIPLALLILFQKRPVHQPDSFQHILFIPWHPFLIE